ncbi:MAG: PQQ-binding-like beta-propeller repeat protein [Phycisphaerales bacterium]|nr:MAG: PQQ-binding-like beta-propeller repeat protein [Phycisphaerales bacterium]
MMKKLVVVLALVFCLYSHASAQEWTRFRGPNGQGHSHAKNIRVKWSVKDYLWTADLPGTGHSSPVIWGDKLFITCCDQKQARASILALSTADGQTLWQKDYQLIDSPMNKLNSYAASAPALDKDRVFVIWPTAKELSVIALDHDGNEQWRKEFGPVYSKHGPCVSPMLYGDLVVFTQEQRTNDKGLKSRWLALDCNDGQIRWEIPRDNGGFISHATPCVNADDSGHDYLVFSSLVYGISAVDPKEGSILWEQPGFSVRALTSPVLAENLIIATCGSGASGKTLMAVRPASKTKPANVAYKIEDRTVPFVSSAIVVNDLLFTFHDQGQVVCRDAQTGVLKWAEKPGGRFFGSPICVEDRLYCMNVDGDVVVLSAADEYELLAVNPLGEKTQATPAVAGGIMYLRTQTKVFAVGQAKD